MWNIYACKSTAGRSSSLAGLLCRAVSQSCSPVWEMQHLRHHITSVWLISDCCENKVQVTKIQINRMGRTCLIKIKWDTTSNRGSFKSKVDGRQNTWLSAAKMFYYTQNITHSGLQSLTSLNSELFFVGKEGQGCVRVFISIVKNSPKKGQFFIFFLNFFAPKFHVKK